MIQMIHYSAELPLDKCIILWVQLIDIWVCEHKILLGIIAGVFVLCCLYLLGTGFGWLYHKFKH